MTTQLNILVKKLQRHKTTLLNLSTVVASIPAHQIPHTFVEQATTLQTQFKNIMEQVEAASIESADDSELDHVYEIEENFNETFFKLLAILPSAGNQTVNQPSNISNSHSSHNFYLPKVKLPTFTGNHEEWFNFKSLFESTIHNSEHFSSAQKFQLLKSHLKDYPLALIDCIPVTDANYCSAYETLRSRYENKRSIVNFHYCRMANFQQSDTQQESLRNFNAVFQSSINALKSIEIDLKDFLLLQLCLQSLPTSVKHKFETKVADTDIPTVEQLLNFTFHQERTTEILSSSNTAPVKPHASNNSLKPNAIQRNVAHHHNPRTFFVQPTTSKALPSQEMCIFCSRNHNIFICELFLELDTSERYKEISKRKRCFACLGTHSRKECKSIKTCKKCGSAYHNTLLHRDEHVSNAPVAEPSELPENIINGNNLLPHTLSCHTSSTSVLLGTASVIIYDSHHVPHILRAILDSGSQISAITKSAVQRLNLNIQSTPITLVGVAEQTTSTSGIVNATIYSTQERDFHLDIKPIVLSRITNKLPNANVSDDIIKRFSHLRLADKNYSKPHHIDLLLGADVYTDLLFYSPNAIIHGQPSAMKTKLGWIITGKTCTSVASNTATTLLTTMEPLHSIVKRFWEIEEVSSPVIVDPENTRCEEIFVKTTTRTTEGRYIVALPFKDNAVPLGTNSRAVTKAYINQERRMLANSDLSSMYHQFMQEYINLGHMKPAPSSSSYLIPHHSVFKTTGHSKKLRVVFNGSANDENSNSLNQQLLSGPKLQKDLSNILISFRMHNYVVCTDIRMMYRQVILRNEDRIHQHILYRPDSSAPLQEYELCTVTYGLKPSAYLAQRTVLELVQNEGKKYPQASHAIANHAYVDDIVTGADTIADTRRLIDELQKLFALGGFELRKWSSNNAELLSNFPSSHLENPLIFTDEHPSIKILGLQWNPLDDSFSYTVVPFEGNSSKRTILSYAARTYDPLGFITPITFFIKHFLQRLWEANLDWDDVIPPTLNSQWEDFKSQILKLKDLRIPRHIGSRSQEYRLLGFCDASEKGYAACIYLHTTFVDHVQVQLIKAKSRVAPIKPVLTIPRLELCAAVLLSRLYESVLDSLSDIRLLEVRLHSDAQLVLTWIKTPPHRLKTFVANRVTLILTLTAPVMWYHISTKDNPADIASRGTMPDTLISCKLWWQGPPHLLSTHSSWPLREHPPTPSNIPELRGESSILLATSQSNHLLEKIETFSSFNKLINTFAYVLRFVHRLRKQETPSSICITVAERKAAIALCARITQSVHFKDDLKLLNKNLPASSALRPLAPFIDEHGSLRVGGRLRNSSLKFDEKHPLLLPKRSHFSQLICDHFHINALHAGPRTTQALIQSQFWIVSLRTLLRSRIHQCLRCHRFRATPSQPIMADLPSARVNCLRPFLSVGIDFAGPFQTKLPLLRRTHLVKGYLCVFVCLSTKAVHLEYVSELSTPAFLAAFDRFTARRGLARDVYSDNGRNFVGAARHYSEMWKLLNESSCSVTSAFASRHINWHFNPPAAPNFGGLWESVVKSAKFILNRVVGDTPLTFEEYTTLFSRIEAILNSRPLYEFSPDPHEELNMLTPGHFLIGEPLLHAPEQRLPEDVTLKTRWMRLRQMIQSFWKHWSHNYLHTQIQRKKWNVNSEPIKKHQIVIMYGMNTNPLKWPLGRVIELHPGPDGIIRIATIKTQDGIFKRPVNKLVTIPHC